MTDPVRGMGRESAARADALEASAQIDDLRAELARCEADRSRPISAILHRHAPEPVRVMVERQRDVGCESCGEPATVLFMFLLDNYRRNPASRAYGRDDCSWCSDLDVFSCESCRRELSRCRDGYAHAPSALSKGGRHDSRFREWVNDKQAENALAGLEPAAIPALVEAAEDVVNPRVDGIVRTEDMLIDALRVALAKVKEVAS